MKTLALLAYERTVSEGFVTSKYLASQMGNLKEVTRETMIRQVHVCASQL